MNILFISCRDFWNGIGGRDNTIKSRIEYLSSNNCHCDVFYFFENNKIVEKDNVSQYSGTSTSNITKIVHSFFNVISRKKPLQYSLFYSKKNKEKLKKLLLINSYDYIIVDMIRLAPLFSLLQEYKKNAKLILDLDDVISKRYKMVQTNVLGTFSGTNKKIEKLLKLKLLKKVVLSTEYRKLYNSEIYYSKLYDMSLLVNPNETNELNKTLGITKAYNLGVFINNNELIEKKYMYKNIFSLFFLGSLKLEQNLVSFDNVVKNILSKISIPYKFYVVGKNDSSIISKYSAINSNIVFTGFVENLNGFLSNMDVMISPIAFGTGIKTKIISAMGHGIPVITNDIGVDGIKCENEKNIIIINSFDEIANKVNYLFNHQDILKNIGREAFSLISNEYSENTFKESIEEIMRNLL